MRRAMTRTTAVAAALIAFGLCCCGGPAPKSPQLTPGDPDYPVENPKSNDVIALTVIVPSTVSVSVNAAYRATLASGTSCDRVVGFGATGRINLTLPISLIREGDTYRGSVAIDRFMPGNCGWQFSGVGFEASKEPFDGGAIALFGEASRQTDPDGQQPQRRYDLWCTRQPRLADDPHNERCTRLTEFRGISPAFSASVSSEESGPNSYININQYTRSLLIKFHDLDTLSGVWEEAH
jgi:hypothetical protein